MPASSFFDAVYEMVRRIPRGRVMTYGQVARRLGVPRGARAVGWALRALRGAQRPPVPWHRVLGSGGRISPRDGAGMLEQRRRLLAEGVRFKGAAVDLGRSGVEAQSKTSGVRAKRSRARRSK